MTEPTRSARRLDLSIAAAVGLLALCARLLFLYASVDRKWPHSVLFEGDAPLWTDWLKAINTGAPFEFGLPIHSPAVAHTLAIICGPTLPADWTGYKVLWCVISALTCSVLYFAALRTLGERSSRHLARPAAIVACVWYALSFHASVLATSLNGEVLYTFLLVSIVAASARPAASRRVAFLTACALGLLHGLATLVRAEHTLLMLMLVAWDLGKPASGAGGAPRIRRVAPGVLTILVSVLVCLPWSIAGTRATQRMNTNAASLPDYDRLTPPWTPDARELMNSIPAFARLDNTAYLSSLAAAAHETQIDETRVFRYFAEEFGYLPQPLRTPVFVSSQGPLCFALANHPDSGGGFSRAAFDTRFGPDPNLTFALPSHLRLYNDGYAVGLGYIKDDPRAWLSNVGQKILRFEGGITGGLGITNFPIGRDLIRQPVDVATVPWPHNLAWRVLVLAAIVAGATRLVIERKGCAWLIVILSKLMVTIAFYGYARQSASVLPCFAILIGCAMTWPLTRSAAARWSMTISASLLAASVIVTDIVEYTRPRLPTIEADQDKVRAARVNAEDGAFECVAPMRIEYVAPDPLTP